MADDRDRRVRDRDTGDASDLAPTGRENDPIGLVPVTARTQSRGGALPGRRLVVGFASALVALVVAGSLLSGGLPQDATQSPGPSTTLVPSAEPTAATATPDSDGLVGFHFDQLHLRVPPSWLQLAGPDAFSGGSLVAIFDNTQVEPCRFRPDVDCLHATPLIEGEYRVTIETGTMRAGTVDDLAPPGGWVTSVDDAPAKVETVVGTAGVGADAFRTWTVAMPGSVDSYYTIAGVYRGPGEDALIAQLDTVARSATFDGKPAPLDVALAPDVLRQNLDSIDRAMRFSFIDVFGCFPRVAGAQATTLRTWFGGPLPAPVAVTCRSAIDATSYGLWRITLTVDWPDGVGYSAGQYRLALYLDSDGNLRNQQVPSGETIPEAPVVTPSPVAAMPEILAGSVVESLSTGGLIMLTPHPNGDIVSGLMSRAYVLGRPESHDGFDWYRIQWQPTPRSPALLGWMASTDDQRHPTMRIVETVCPTGPLDIPDLAALIPGERLTCFGDRDLTLAYPVQAEDVEPDVSVRSTPGWLADESRWMLYGRDGAAGVLGGMRASLDPSFRVELRPEAWYRVIGHYDDARSGTCQRYWNGDDAPNLSPESGPEQILSCREHFVVTSAVEVSGPG